VHRKKEEKMKTPTQFKPASPADLDRMRQDIRFRADLTHALRAIEQCAHPTIVDAARKLLDSSGLTEKQAWKICRPKRTRKRREEEE
jgi:hypothetical protein